MEVFQTDESLLIFLTVGEMPCPSPPPPTPSALASSLLPECSLMAFEKVCSGAAGCPGGHGGLLPIFFQGDAAQKFYAIKKEKRGDKGGLKRKPAGRQGEDLKLKKKKSHCKSCHKV